MRSRQVILAPGYDGEFGVVKVFDEGERSAFSGQVGFQVPGFEFRVPG